MIVPVAFTDDPRGLIVDDGERAVLIPTRALRQREVLVAEVEERLFECRSRLRNENPDLERLIEARRELTAWDHVHLFDEFLRARSDDEDIDYLLGHAPDLPWLNLNAVLSHCFNMGMLSAETFESSFAYVAHSREGFEHLERQLGLHRRAWHCEDTAILICPRERPGAISYVGDLALLPEHLNRYPDAAIQPAIVDALLRDLVAEAEALGIPTEIATRSDQLLARLAGEGTTSQTLLLAHQDDGLVQLADRDVRIREIYEAAHEQPRGGAWYLAVCGSDGAGQLAGALQSNDRPFIVTGGPISIVQDQLGFMIALLRTKARHPEIEFERAIRHVQITARQQRNQWHSLGN
jgi:hypothetical protein